jgi:ribosomal-protein-alanine N-acetyltransferase
VSDLRIATDRLVLRRMTMEDVPALHAILSDPDAMRYWSTLPHEHEALTEAWVAQTIEAVAAGHGDDFVVLLGHAVVGKVGLWQGDEIGIILSRAIWGRGYASEALSATIERAFGRGILRITADIDPRNAASLRLFRNLGFRETGSAEATFQIGAVSVDSLYFALTPEDWSSGKPPSGARHDRSPDGDYA